MFVARSGRTPLGVIRNSAKLLRSASTSSARVGKPPPAARAFAIASLEERRERGRLWERHDRLERQWRAVRVVAVGDAADRMAEDLDRRLRHVLVIIRRTRLAEGLQLPGLVLTRFDICPGLDPGEAVEPLGAGVWPCPAAEEDGVVWARAGGDRPTLGSRTRTRRRPTKRGRVRPRSLPEPRPRPAQDAKRRAGVRCQGDRRRAEGR